MTTGTVTSLTAVLVRLLGEIPDQDTDRRGDLAARLGHAALPDDDVVTNALVVEREGHPTFRLSVDGTFEGAKTPEEALQIVADSVVYGLTGLYRVRCSVTTGADR